VPWQYYASGKIYAFMHGKTIKGGLVLIPGYWNLRSILQMPVETQVTFYALNPEIANNLCDNTGYFILNLPLKYSVLFAIRLFFVVLFYPKKYHVYTYPVSDKALEKYYARGNPIRIYSGKPQHLPGHHASMESENVEIISRWGLLKIFFFRTKKLIELHIKRVRKNRRL
jgi:hypothetical protein